MMRGGEQGARRGTARRCPRVGHRSRHANPGDSRETSLKRAWPATGLDPASWKTEADKVPQGSQSLELVPRAGPDLRRRPRRLCKSLLLDVEDFLAVVIDRERGERDPLTICYVVHPRLP